MQAAYTAGHERLHMCYGFDLLSNIYPTGTWLAEVMTRASEPGAGWACWAYSNHDVARHASRWNLPPSRRSVMLRS